MLQKISMLLCAIFLSSCTTARFTAQQQISSFHIGNSLTWDSKPAGVAALAAARAYKARAGYHICCGRPLAHIARHPKDVCVKTVKGFGLWESALLHNKLDFVTLQPYTGSTLKGEEDAVVNLIELCRSGNLNKQTIFYIYAAWPPRQDFAKTWSREYEDRDDNRSVLCGQFFEHLIKRVRRRVDAPVYLIPAGEVLYNIDIELKKGRIPGLNSVADLFRDRVHLKIDIGRFIVAVTKFCSIYRENPEGLKKPVGFYGKSAKAYSSEYYQLVYETVRRVLRNNSYTD